MVPKPVGGSTARPYCSNADCPDLFSYLHETFFMRDYTVLKIHFVGTASATF